MCVCERVSVKDTDGYGDGDSEPNQIECNANEEVEWNEKKVPSTSTHSEKFLVLHNWKVH